MKRAVVLLNLGTPTDPSPRAVGRYLREFLMDPSVLQMSGLARWFLVHVLIVPLRKYRSAQLYQKIWTKEGSPLFVLTQKLTQALGSKSYDTFMSFRYGRPSLEDALASLSSYQEILFIPLYPQEADSSTTTSRAQLEAAMAKSSLREHRVGWVQNFYREPHYIQAMAEIIREDLFGRKLSFESFDHVVFSFHSLPESQLVSHDLKCETCLAAGTCQHVVESCYRHQCESTAESLRSELQIPREKFSVTYQSRLGRAKWITPSTESTLLSLAAAGKSRILLYAPGFVCDCLETLEELDYELRVKFQTAGGKLFVRPRCLNDHPIFVRHFRIFIDAQFEKLDQLALVEKKNV